MIETIVVLYVLAGLDTMFSGICAASGRNALIHKRAYYAKSMLYGFAWGQVACLLGLAILVFVAILADDRPRVVAEMVAVGRRMVTIYAVYAAVVLLTFAARAVPSVDVRSITSTVGFGPLTVVRPAVILVGIAWGLALGPSPSVTIAAIAIATIMVPFRIWLNLLLDAHGIDVLYPRETHPGPADQSSETRGRFP